MRFMSRSARSADLAELSFKIGASVGWVGMGIWTRETFPGGPS